MNGNGIQPTVELATTNGAYPYPVMYGNNGFGGNSGFWGSDAIWIIILLALFGGFGNGNGGFVGFNNDYAWLSNGQKDIMTNTNNGFNTLHLSDQVEGVRDGIWGISNAICNSTASINSNISNGFANAEVSNNARQIANMQQAFNDTLATQKSFNDLNTSFLNCCCENRLGLANLNSTILAENCQDRAVLQEGVRDIIASQQNGVQRILDQLCQDKIDSKNEKITDLQRELLMKDLQASQIQQTATLRLGQEAEVDALYNRLNSCPVPSTPVYGRTPIFTCNNNGCGCNNGNYLYN